MRPSSLAVLRLMTSSNFDACSIGKSPAFSPFKILANKHPHVRDALRKYRDNQTQTLLAQTDPRA